VAHTARIARAYLLCHMACSLSCYHAGLKGLRGRKGPAGTLGAAVPALARWRLIVRSCLFGNGPGWLRCRRVQFQIVCSLDKTADTVHDMLARPQLSGHDISPVGEPYVSPAQHHGIEAGSVLTAAFVAGLLADRIARWIRQHWKRP
jgi:hypothetical protein